MSRFHNNVICSLETLEQHVQEIETFKMRALTVVHGKEYDIAFDRMHKLVRLVKHLSEGIETNLKNEKDDQIKNERDPESCTTKCIFDN